MRGDTLYDILTHYTEYRNAYYYYKKVRLHTKIAFLALLMFFPFTIQSWTALSLEFTILFYIVIFSTYNNFQAKITNFLSEYFLTHFHREIWDKAFLFQTHYKDLKRIVSWSLSSHGNNLHEKIKNNHNYEENI